MTFRAVSSLLCLLLPALVAAQSAQSTIAGRVVDSSKAPVPDATVEITNTETNQSVRAVTDAAGVYSSSFLRPGSYSVSVEVPGFRPSTRDGLALGVNEVLTVDLVVEVGPVTEEVAVTAEPALLQTANADRGGVIDKQRVHELPINGRNPFMLGRLVAGTSFSGQAVWERPFDNGAIAAWHINGSPNRTNEFLLDGAPNNAQAGGNNIALVPPVDSVQEFKIQTNSYDAEYGHTGGGIINVSLKSGTNNFDGAAYEFLRREWLDATSFQNNAADEPKDQHYLDQYGIQLGGPILRNRTFFMVNYERYREGTPRPFTASVPAPEFLNGDFSNLVDGQGRPITIYNPFSGREVDGVWVRDPFSNNQIPEDMINPIAKAILAYHPPPNTTTEGSAYAQDNFFFTGDDAIDADTFYNLVVKVDHNFGDRHRMFFRHASNDRTQFGHDFGNVITGVGERGSLPHFRTNYAEAIDWVSVLGLRTTLNWRLSYNRFVEGERGDNNVGFDMTSLGFPESLVSQLPGGAFFGRYDWSGYQSLGMYPNRNVTNNWAFHPTLTTTLWQGHSTKFGVDMRWIQYADQDTDDVLRLSATSDWTQKEWNRSDSLSGHPVASWLLGTPSSGSAFVAAMPITMGKYYAPWIQDDWRVTDRLTINLGLRWDFNIPPTERFDRLNRGFDESAINPIDGLVDRGKFSDLPTLRGGLLFAGAEGQPREAANVYKNAVQPRVGFAYRLRDDLVVRGGWGRFYINPSNDFIQTNGFSIETPLVTSLDGGRTPIPGLINDPFPTGVLQPPGASEGLMSALGQSVEYVDPEFKLPYVNQFSIGFQYQLPGQSTIDIAYSGSRGHDLQGSLDDNLMALDLRQQCYIPDGGDPLLCDEEVLNPFFELEPFRGTSLFTSPTVSRAELGRPYPHFGDVTNVTRNDGKTWYDSLQVQYQARYSGLNLLVSYTLSEMTEQSGWLDSQRLIPQKSLALRDTPHRIAVSAVWELPFGPGRRFGNNTGPFLGRLVSGWQAALIFQYQSGWPWNLPSNAMLVEGRDPSLGEIDWSQPIVTGVDTCVARWNDDGSITMVPHSVQAGCTDYTWLVMPRYGPDRHLPARDGRVRLHSVPIADLSLSKQIRISEGVSFQFRFEVFNLFNTYMHNRQNFNNDPESSSFGTITRAAVSSTNTNLPRNIQLGFKVLW